MLRKTMTGGQWSMDCDRHDEMDQCGHWVHELFIHLEFREEIPTKEGHVWVVLSQSFLDFLGTKRMAVKEGWET
jgi:hypothetical protein